MSTTRPCRAGFTLLELLISVGLLGLVFAAVGMVSGSTNSLARFSSDKSRTEVRARQTLDRVVEELSTLGSDLMLPDPEQPAWTATLDFQKATGVAGGAVTWGEPMRITFELEAGELDDGLDNDSDGLTDESRVVLIRNFGAANQLRVVICHGAARLAEGELDNGVDDNGNGMVDESGFNLQRTGNLMAVRLSLQETVEGGQVVTRSVETSFRLRN
jgi:prepilin-type N-terminal cleavage/methylation domain-containing protein